MLAELIVKEMREIGAPKHTDDEIKFAEKMSETIEYDKKMNSLQKSNRPDWEKLGDVQFDERILDDYRAGMVGAGSTDVSDVSWITPTIEFSTTCCMLGTPGHSWQYVAQNGMSIGHKGLIFSTKVHAAAGLELLTSSDLLKKVMDIQRSVQFHLSSKYQNPQVSEFFLQVVPPQIHLLRSFSTKKC